MVNQKLVKQINNTNNINKNSFILLMHCLNCSYLLTKIDCEDVDIKLNQYYKFRLVYMNL